MQPKAALLLPSGVGSSGGKLGAKSSVTDGQRWDGWGRLTQSLFSTVPHMATIGACTCPTLASRTYVMYGCRNMMNHLHRDSATGSASRQRDPRHATDTLARALACRSAFCSTRWVLHIIIQYLVLCCNTAWDPCLGRQSRDRAGQLRQQVRLLHCSLPQRWYKWCCQCNHSLLLRGAQRSAHHLLDSIYRPHRRQRAVQLVRPTPPRPGLDEPLCQPLMK